MDLIGPEESSDKEETPTTTPTQNQTQNIASPITTRSRAKARSTKQMSKELKAPRETIQYGDITTKRQIRTSRNVNTFIMLYNTHVVSDPTTPTSFKK